MVWVPGYSNIGGNETADQLARLASSSRFIGPEPILPIPASLVYAKAAGSVNRLAADAWANEGTCRFTKVFLPSLRQRWSRFLIKLNKHRLRQLTQAITGHSVLNAHLFRMRLHPSGLCDYCGEAETMEHFLCRCINWEELRSSIYGASHCDLALVSSSSISKLLRFVIGSVRLS